MMSRLSVRLCHLILGLAILAWGAWEGRAQSPLAVTLLPSTSPTAAEPGVTNLSVTGSNFPAGTIPAANVTVTLKPTGGGATVTTPATAVASVVGTTRRVSFTVPGSVSVAAPAAYAATIAGTTSTGTAFASSNSAALTVNPAATIIIVAPNSGTQGQTLSVAVTGSYSNWLQGSTIANFGAGITVTSTTVTNSTHATANITITPSAATGPLTVTMTTGVEVATLASGFNVLSVGPTITDFNPRTGPIGTLVTITGANFGVAPQISMSHLNGGTVNPPPSSIAINSLSFVVSAGAATGPITVSNGTGSTTSQAPFTVTPSTGFTLSLAPPSANLIQGQSVSYSVSLATTNGFNQLAQLSLSGAPSGVTASFTPPSITTGQTSVITLNAPANQPLGSSTLTITASANVQGLPVSQSATAQLLVQAPTTSFLGRTVVANSQETPLAGVTVSMLGKDGNGNSTGCTGSTVSDGAGNFALVNLPAMCVGPQLIGYNGTTATSPAGTYAGVNIVYTLVLAQVTASPVLVHLPRIDNVETFYVTQNAATNQSYSYTSIPGLSVTVYAGTTFTLQDGTQPTPFPLAAVQVPVDRLPDLKPQVPTMIRAFIVAFQPANATTNEPVAVYFPNTLNSPPGEDGALMTLDPTHGQMVPYGTGAVSADGTQIIPDPDPSHPGHLYGLIHFDWHGWMATTAPTVNPSPPCNCPTPPNAGGYIDIGSGIDVIKATDIAINGARGGIAIERTFRTLSTNPGPFGIGSGFNYGYQLAISSVISLIMPDGNQFPFNIPQSGGFINNTIPSLRGAVLTASGARYNLRWKDGTVYQFQLVPGSGRLATMTAVIDANGNTVTLTLNFSGLSVTQITDPVGRSLNLGYDGSGRIVAIVDPIGRTVKYTYNAAGYLATVTDPNQGITTYNYDGQNRLVSVQDPRGVVTEQNTYDANGRVIRQTQADGGSYQFSYSLLNPLIIDTPPMTTMVTDPLGRLTTYRFTPNQIFFDATDPTGQETVFTLDPTHNNLAIAISGTGVCSSCGDRTQGNQSWTLDQNDNFLANTDADGNTTTLTYDPVFSRVTSITDPLGNVTSFAYDAHGNLTAATDANGNTTSYQYDTNGLLILATDPLNQKTEFVYDSSGNLVSVTDPLGNTTSYAYDVVSRLTAIKDAVGRQTSFTYDALNRLLTQTDAKTGVTQLSYDPNGNLLSLTDAKGNATTYTYDGMNRPVTLTNSLGESASAAYDVNGNLIGFTDRRKQNSSYTYDTLNRLVTETCEDSTVAISYDANGHPVQVNDSASGDFTFTYDAAGRLTGTATPYGAVEYTRDGLGRASSRQVAGQPPVAYTYDKAGNLLNASTPTASVTRSYDPRNLLSTASRMNHVSSQYNYDQLGRLTSLTHTGPGGVLISQTYSYDAAGNRTNATNSTAQSLITQAVTPTSYNADNEQLQFGSTSNTFDANGNLTASTAAAANTVYTWDSRHRLTSLSAPNGQVTTFTYDFAGNLLQQRDVGPTANVTQTFVLDDLTNIAYVNRSDGDQYSVLAGQWIDDHMATMHTSGLTEYGLGDALDSTHATVDQTGAAKGQFYYDPFGQTIAANSTYPFQYTGRTPVSNGLYYYRARYYSPAMGRFISEDVNPRTQLANLYVYALNSPAELTDPSGRQSIAVVPTIFTLYTLCLANMPLCTAMAQSCFNGAAGVTSPPQKIYNIAAMPVGWLCRSVSESIQNGLAYLRRPRPKSPRIPPCPDGFEIQISGGTTARGYPPLP